MGGEEKRVNVIFGSEFDGTGIKDGAAEMVDSLEEAKEAEAELQKQIADTNKEMEANEGQIQQLNKVLLELSKRLDKTADPFGKVNKEMETLKKRNAELTAQYEAQKKQLDDVTKKLNAFEKAGKSAGKAKEGLGKAFSKFTDTNKIANKLIDDYSKKLGKAAKALLEGFAIGIAAQAVPALIQLAAELVNASTKLSEFEKDTKLAGEIQSKASEIYSADVAKLELFRAKLTDTNIKQSERVKLAQEYNKTAAEGNKIDITQINNLELINAQINKQIDLLKKRATARAAENVIAERAEALFKKQIDIETRFPQFGEKTIERLTTLAESAAQTQADLLKLGKVDIKELFAFADLPEPVLTDLAKKNKRLQVLLDDRTRAFVLSQKSQLNLIETARSGERAGIPGLRTAVKELDEAQKEFERALRVGIELTDIESLLPADTQRSVTNVFEQKLRELRERLAQVSASVFQSEDLIKKQFDAKLTKEFGEIATLLKNKQLTGPQADILRALLRQINEIELTKGLEEFRKKREEAIRAVNEQILNLQLELATQRIAALQDEFIRERETIDLESEKTIAAIKRQQETLFRSIDEQIKAGTIDAATGENKKAILNAIFGGLFDQAEQNRLRKQAELAFKQFNTFLQTLRNQFDNVGIGLSEATTREIQEASQQFIKGQISYERYQKKLTEITRREARNRQQIQLNALEEELKLINARLQQTSDESQRRQLEERQRVLRGQISALQREMATGGAEDLQNAEKERLDNLVKYVEAVGALANAVLSFWNQVNAAEAAALDRSIGYQQKRVEFAREIAEKGNAEYLEMEQKRLDELERKREQNAQRQLAINNAITVSQALVAAVSAIAQAVSTGSPFAAIAAVTAVVGAIAAAYQFVNSLQPPVAQFAEGEEYVSGAGHKAGIDTVPARLTAGERVITKRENADYWDALHAIHNRTIPPAVLNDFVNLYPVSSVPTVDFDRLATATGNMYADSAEVVSELHAMQNKMDEVVEAVASIGINVNMNEQGFAAAITTYQRKMKKRNRS